MSHPKKHKNQGVLAVVFFGSCFFGRPSTVRIPAVWCLAIASHLELGLSWIPNKIDTPLIVPHRIWKWWLPKTESPLPGGSMSGFLGCMHRIKHVIIYPLCPVWHTFLIEKWLKKIIIHPKLRLQWVQRSSKISSATIMMGFGSTFISVSIFDRQSIMWYHLLVRTCTFVIKHRMLPTQATNNQCKWMFPKIGVPPNHPF